MQLTRPLLVQGILSCYTLQAETHLYERCSYSSQQTVHTAGYRLVGLMHMQERVCKEGQSSGGRGPADTANTRVQGRATGRRGIEGPAGLSSCTSRCSSSLGVAVQGRVRGRMGVQEGGLLASPAGSVGSWGGLRPCSRWWAAALTPWLTTSSPSCRREPCQTTNASLTSRQACMPHSTYAAF